MENSVKAEIRLLTQVFIDTQAKNGKSQKEAIKLLKETSEATIINMLNDKWSNISDKMWFNVGKQVGYTNVGSWKLVPTKNYKRVTSFLEDAKDYNNVHCLIATSGYGKTFPTEYYAKHHANVYHVECDDYWNKKMFLNTVLAKIGKRDTGYNISEMMECMVDVLRKQDTPLLVIDEADKLNDQVLYFFITLYNRLKGKCGIVLLGTEYLEKRIIRGVKLKRKGFAEIYSRIGKKFIYIKQISNEEIKDIIVANGITDIEIINQVINSIDGDLRCLEKQVHKHKRLMERKNKAA